MYSMTQKSIQQCGLCRQELLVENDYVNCAYCGKQLAEHDNWTMRGEPVHSECGIRAAVEALGHHEVIPAITSLRDATYHLGSGPVEIIEDFVNEVRDLLDSLTRTIHDRSKS